MVNGRLRQWCDSGHWRASGVRAEWQYVMPCAQGPPFDLRASGAVDVTGHVLDISKHENIARTARPELATGARLYRFPSRTPVTQAELKTDTVAAVPPKRRWRLRLALEIGIGVLICLGLLAWYLLN